MAAILRVKRRNTDSPLDTLVIASKRPKTEVSHSDTPTSPTMKTVVQFAGTLTDPTDDMATILPKINVENHRAGIKRLSDNDCLANASCKILKREETERYKIIGYQYSRDRLDKEEPEDKWMALIDVEDTFSILGLTDQTTKEDLEDYVYDLYYTQTCDDVWLDSGNIWVRPEYAISDFETDNEDEDDSSDSNAESHWRNDYPDTDPDRSKSQSSRDSDSDDNLDIFNDNDYDEDDEGLYSFRMTKSKYGHSYGRGWELDSNSDSDLSDNEDNVLNSGRRLDDEIKSAHDEEIADNEEM